MPLQVWYLDDEKDLCENFAALFETPDLSIQTFTDPTALLEAARANRPDLLLLDYRLPRTTGDEVALALDPSIPKVLVTGDPSVPLKAKFMRVLSKPYRVADVRTLLAEFLATHQV